jgi:hypothetical protein
LHVTSLEEITDIVGAPGGGEMTITVGVEAHPPVVVVTLYVPGARPLKIPVAFVWGATIGVVPVIVKLVPVAGAGAVTVTVAVGTAQVGNVVTLAVGALGVAS